MLRRPGHSALMAEILKPLMAQHVQPYHYYWAAFAPRIQRSANLPTHHDLPLLLLLGQLLISEYTL